MPKGPVPRAPEERFWQYVAHEPNTGCWLWFGNVTTLGYGMLRVGSMSDGTRRWVMAHRLSYEMHCRALLKEEVIDHLCRVPGCVNPQHLEPVSTQLNVKRGLQGDASTNKAANVNKNKTHCKNGHEYSGVNLHVSKSGERICLTCRRKSGLKHYYKKMRHA